MVHRHRGDAEASAWSSFNQPRSRSYRLVLPAITDLTDLPVRSSGLSTKSTAFCLFMKDVCSLRSYRYKLM